MTNKNEQKQAQDQQQEQAQNENKKSADSSVPQQDTLSASEAKSDNHTEESLAPEKQIEALQAELLQTKDRMMRALADAENTRKRALKERDEAGKFAIANFARDLLDFSDNFRRALKSLPEDTPAAIMEGLLAMDKELLSVFERHGITKIDPLDEIFDPNLHEVMFETPMPDKVAGQIIQVIEPGYVIKDRLLRAAKVGVARTSDDTPQTDPGAKVDIQG